MMMPALQPLLFLPILLTGNAGLQAVSDDIPGLLILLLVTLPGFYIPYIWNKERNMFREITALHMLDRRRLEGTVTNDEKVLNELANSYLENAFNCWTIVEKTEEEEYRSPTTMKQIRTSMDWINQTIALKPVDQGIIARLNELGGIIMAQMKRQYKGSNFLLIISAITFLILVFWASPGNNLLAKIWSQSWLLFSMGLYVVSSFSPFFLIERRQKSMEASNRNGSLMAALRGFFWGLFMATPASGSRSSSGCTSVLFLIVAVAVLFMLAFFLWIFALVNFVRNYIIYT